MYYDFIPESGSYLWGKDQGSSSEKYPRIDKVRGMSAESPEREREFRERDREPFRGNYGKVRLRSNGSHLGRAL